MAEDYRDARERRVKDVGTLIEARNRTLPNFLWRLLVNDLFQH
jgi:hypothetical protein